MSTPRWPSRYVAVAAGLGLLLSITAWAASLRISNLVVTNWDNALLVNAVLLGSLPDGIVEGLRTGIPATVRYQVELWQNNSWWVDRRVVAKLVERQVVYDVLTKEFRISAVQGEQREPYVTREIWEVERVLSEIRALRLAEVPALPPEDLYYVRVRAEISSGAPDASFSKILPLMSSRVETAWEQTPLLAIRRTR
jgi:hypothetical protein